jgi:hypothetical protein
MSNAATPQILMPTPTPTQSDGFDKERYTKVMGLTIERDKIAEFDAGIKALGWKSRRTWLSACIDTVIEQTETLRESSAAEV